MVTKKLIPTAEDIRIARFAALAIGLALVDASIPSPLSGIKPGLANIVALIVLVRFGFRMTVNVMVLRVLASSLFLKGIFIFGFCNECGGGCK